MTQRKINPEIQDLIDEFITHHRVMRGHSERTTEAYASELLYIFDILEKKIFKNKDWDYNIKDITARHISRIIKIFRDDKNNSDTTLGRKISSLKSFYSWLDTYILDNDPEFKNIMRKIPIPKKSEEEPKVPNLNDVKYFLNYVRDRKYKCDLDKDNYILFFHLAYLSMARIFEMPKIKVRDIDLERQEGIIHGKGKKERPLLLDAKTCDLIKDYIEKYDLSLDDYLIRGRTGEITARALSKRMNDILDEINEKLKSEGKKLKDFSWMTSHKMLRKAPATRLKENGVDIVEIQKLLGHSDIKTTMKYVASNIEKTRESFKAHHPHTEIYAD